MAKPSVHERLYFSYTLPLAHYGMLDLYKLRLALFPATERTDFQRRDYNLHPEYVRCGHCGAFHHNLLGIPDVIIFGCRSCELKSHAHMTVAAHSQMAAQNWMCRNLTREEMLEFNQAARPLITYLESQSCKS